MGEKLAQKRFIVKICDLELVFHLSHKPLQNRVLNTLKTAPLMILNACFKEGFSFSICIRLILE